MREAPPSLRLMRQEGEAQVRLEKIADSESSLNLESLKKALHNETVCAVETTSKLYKAEEALKRISDIIYPVGQTEGGATKLALTALSDIGSCEFIKARK